MERIFIIFEIISVVFMCLYVIFYFEELRRYYRKYIGILSIYLALIGISMLFIVPLYTFHSDVFSTHDRSLSQQNSYSWLNLNDVYKFPIDQLKLDEENYSFQNPPISYPRQNVDSLAHLILFDATKSGKETDEYKKKIRSSIVASNKMLKAECNEYADTLNHFGELLFVKTILKTSKLPHTHIKAGIYYGSDDCKIIEDKFKIINGDNVCDYVKKAVKETNTIFLQDIKDQKTDYCQLVCDIKERLLSINQTSDFVRQKIALTLIGDFYDEKGDFDKLGKSLNELRNENKNLNQINLLVIPNIEKKSKGRVDSTIDKFKIIFGKILNYTELKATDLEDEGLKLFDPITSFTQLTTETIILYNPYNLFNREEKAVGKITFEDIGENLDVYLCLKSDDNIDKSYSYFFNGDRMGLNTPYIKKNQKNNIIEITNVNSVKQHNVYLEYHNLKENFKLKIPIIIRDRLSRTISLSLIFFYSILFTCAFIMCLTFILITKKVAGRRNNGVWNSKYREWALLTLSVLIVMCLISFIYCYSIINGSYLLLTGESTTWECVFTILSPTIFLWIIFFRYGKVKLLFNNIFN
jgi:hypothetical protein